MRLREREKEREREREREREKEKRETDDPLGSLGLSFNIYESDGLTLVLIG